MFDPPIFMQSTYVISFLPITNIRRRVMELEDIFEARYSQAQLFPIPDNFDADVPRIVFTSKHGYSQVNISQASIILQANYDDNYNLHPEKIKDYLDERVGLLFSAVKTIGTKVLFSGVSNTIRLNTKYDNKAVIDYIQNKYINSHTTMNNNATGNDIVEAQFRLASVVDNQFFNVVTISNFRSWNALTRPASPIIRFPTKNVTNQGIEINHDFNDRFSYNEDESYFSSAKTAKKLLILAFDSLAKMLPHV